MNELQAIVEAAETAWREGKEALLATVVGVRGSAYRRPGARMLFTADGWQAGSISGGCLEGDILRRAWWHTRTGAPTVITYDSTVDEEDVDSDLSWGFGLGCNGVVEVLLERISLNAPCCPVRFISRCLERNRSGVLATVVSVHGSETVQSGQRLLLHDEDAADSEDFSTIRDRELRLQVQRDACRLLESGGASQGRTYVFAGEGATAEVFLEVVTPPISLLICGSGHDAVPLAMMAKNLGWDVTVMDPRPGSLARPDRFPGADTVIACAPHELAARVVLDDRTLCVVMSHNVFLDATLLETLLPSAVRYIGVLGPRRRTERLLASLGRQEENRLHGPVGLDIGADTPQSIALSILAEMQAVLSGRPGNFLRDREQPIHDPMPRQEAPSPSRPIAKRPVAKVEPVTCALTTSV